uniref:THAP domain-containing protein 2-like n=1 Tax=Myxine glutinosa TaxID=7769 RepID=UPI00358E3948
MPGCCAFGCTNRHDKGFKMYRFPSDPNRRKIWENKVSRVGWKPASSSKLCEAHFDPHQFECGRADQKMKLKNSAVPTIFCHRRTTKSRKSPKKRDRPTKAMCPPKQHETSLLVDHSYAADPQLQRLSSCYLIVKVKVESEFEDDSISQEKGEAQVVKSETFQNNVLQTSQDALSNDHVKQELCDSPPMESLVAW